jgi:hypothetical protein
LSVETIINLAHNGVTKKVFLELLQKSLADLVEPLLDWDSPEAMRKLWTNVRRLGGVMAARRAREEAGLARVKGLSEREAEEIEIEDEEDFNSAELAEQRSSAWWGDEVSGCPSSLEETIMYMIDSGLTPKECPLLRDKLDKFIRSRLINYIKSYRIDVPMSAAAFLVPGENLHTSKSISTSLTSYFQTHPGSWRKERCSLKVLDASFEPQKDWKPMFMSVMFCLLESPANCPQTCKRFDFNQ